MARNIQVLLQYSVRNSDRLKSGLLAGFSQELEPESVKYFGKIQSDILTALSPVYCPDSVKI